MRIMLNKSDNLVNYLSKIPTFSRKDSGFNVQGSRPLIPTELIGQEGQYLKGFSFETVKGENFEKKPVNVEKVVLFTRTLDELRAESRKKQETRKIGDLVNASADQSDQA